MFVLLKGVLIKWIRETSYLSIYPLICLSISSSIHLLISQSLSVSIYPSTTYLFIYLSVCLSTSIYLSTPIYLSVPTFFCRHVKIFVMRHREARSSIVPLFVFHDEGGRGDHAAGGGRRRGRVSCRGEARISGGK